MLQDELSKSLSAMSGISVGFVENHLIIIYHSCWVHEPKFLVHQQETSTEFYKAVEVIPDNCPSSPNARAAAGSSSSASSPCSSPSSASAAPSAAPSAASTACGTPPPSRAHHNAVQHQRHGASESPPPFRASASLMVTYLSLSLSNSCSSLFPFSLSPHLPLSLPPERSWEVRLRISGGQTAAAAAA